MRHQTLTNLRSRQQISSNKKNEGNKQHYASSQSMNKQSHISNQQLIMELHSLLSNEEIIKYIDFELQERIENVLTAAKLENASKSKSKKKRKEGSNQNILKQVNLSNTNNIKSNTQSSDGKNKGNKTLKQHAKLETEEETSQKPKSKFKINLFSQQEEEQLFKQNHQGREKIGTKNSNQCRSKSKPKNNVLSHHKSEKNIKIQGNKKLKTKFKVIKQVPDPGSKSRSNLKSIKTSLSKSKQRKLVTSESKGKLEQRKYNFNNITSHKQNSKSPSVNLTAFITRDPKNHNKQIKTKPTNSSLDKRHLKSDKSLQKLNIQKANMLRKKIQSMEQKLDEENMQKIWYGLSDHHITDSQQLFEQKQNEAWSHVYEEQMKQASDNKFHITAQFIQKISELQKQTENEEQSLQESIRELKNRISLQKSALESTTNRISIMKDQINDYNENTTSLTTKKKENHIKLQGIWNQVKTLNGIIVEAKKQNEEVLGNLNEETGLIKMYHTVIEELKQQLKIQVETRDSFKNKLKHSKKNQHAIKHKANSTKEKNELMMSTVRESISKWIA